MRGYRLKAAAALAAWALVAVAAAGMRAQARRTTTEAPEVTCPATLGVGLNTGLTFCDVLTARDPAEGILVKIPRHRGDAILTFDLHNRHTYSEDQVRANRAYTRYTAVIGVLTMDNTLITRAVVQNEFRRASDIVDRIKSDLGPMGVKAVVPTGTEHVRVTIPQAESQVSIMGEKVMVERLDGAATYSSPGRPIAVISSVMIEYRPR